jgi:hypothetical protein
MVTYGHISSRMVMTIYDHMGSFVDAEPEKMGA